MTKQLKIIIISLYVLLNINCSPKIYNTIIITHLANMGNWQGHTFIGENRKMMEKVQKKNDIQFGGLNLNYIEVEKEITNVVIKYFYKNILSFKTDPEYFSQVGESFYITYYQNAEERHLVFVTGKENMREYCVGLLKELENTGSQAEYPELKKYLEFYLDF